MTEVFKSTFSEKHGESLLRSYELKYLTPLVSLIPKWIKSYHLTLLSILWSLLIVLFSYFARENIKWLWLVSLTIFFQYLSDYFDGSVGRYRNDGLAKWGYYMDHLLDYIFLASIFLGYFMIVDEIYKYYVFFLFVLMAGFMISSFLYFSVSNKFKTCYLGLGPTEERLLLIIVNSLSAVYGKVILENSLFFFLSFHLLVLIYVIYKAQKEIWFIDLNKEEN
ncbi:MAG: CDP-alcohol phosphatidyltransferase family protein [Candidatus Melainabacteria bacterium]|nr:CDP-alcohol phosphatidyltransferase family protein [Candidatus Melainabacteria bacterium]